MGRHQDVDVVDLQQAELPDDPADVARVNPSPRSRAVEALGREGDPARFMKR